MQQQVNQMIGLLATGIGGLKHLQQQKQQIAATQSLQEIIDQSANREVDEFIGNVAGLTGFEEGSKLDLVMQAAAEATEQRYNTDQMVEGRKKLVQQLRNAPAGVVGGIGGTKNGK